MTTFDEVYIHWEHKCEYVEAEISLELAPYKYLREVAFIEALPRRDTGKVQRFVLRDRAAGEVVS